MSDETGIVPTEIRTAVEKRVDPATQFVEQIENRWRLAKYMVSSGMVPQKRPEEVIAVMLKGYELGIPPMMAAANIHVIKGTPTLSAHLMLGLAAERAGVRWEVIEHDDKVCRMKFTRDGWPDHTEEYAIAQAEKAGLTRKDNWKNDPKAMLFARCASRGVRTIAPDVLAGQYSYEEFADVEKPYHRADNVGVDPLNEKLKAAEEIEVEEDDEAEAPAEDERSEAVEDTADAGAEADLFESEPA